jgi:uncharacterized protein YacL (UPF0231 family)
MPSKHDIHDIIEFTNSKGFKFLSTEYSGQSAIYDFECPRGHPFKTSWKVFQRNQGCRTCAVDNRRTELAKVQNLLDLKKFTVTHAFEYVNKDTPIDVCCENGHPFKTSYSKLKYYGCLECSGYARNTIEKMQPILQDVEILNEYVSAHAISNFMCNICGHTFPSKYYKLYLSKVKCPKCRKNVPSPLRKESDFVLAQITKAGYTYIGGEYKHNRSKLSVICDKGHSTKVTWFSWQNGCRCRECWKEKEKPPKKYSTEYIQEYLKQNGLKLLKRKGKEITVECSKGHTTTRNWYNTHTNKRFCTKCKMNKPEREIIDFLQTDLGITHIKHRERKIIGNKELDIYLPDFNLAIEYNGLFWHSEKMMEDYHYHFKKQQLCLQKGIGLITIWQDEWEYKRNIVMDILRRRLVQSKVCESVEYTTEYGINDIRLEKFFTTNQLEDFNTAFNKHICLTSPSSEICAAVTYLVKKDKLIIAQFCNRSNYDDISVLKRFLSEIESKQCCSRILMTVDRRYFDEDLLVSAGFILESVGVNYRWTDFQKTYSQKPKGKYAFKISDNGLATYVKTIGQG